MRTDHAPESLQLRLLVPDYRLEQMNKFGFLVAGLIVRVFHYV